MIFLFASHNLFKAASILASFLLFFTPYTKAQVPLVYNSENTGASCTPPPFPTMDQLPVVEPLPDPFMFDAPGGGRSTNFMDWMCRRNEIKRQIENYEIGIKPPRPDTITATYVTEPNGGRLTVIVVRNGRTLTLSSHINLPTSGSGPFPAVIGMALAPGAGPSSGSVPSDIFTSRNIATIEYVHNQVTTYAAGQKAPKVNDPFYLLYPELINNGQYSAWIWGVSRLIDGLEIVRQQILNPAPIDLNRLAVTGCSYAGKMALFAGAFDERIALTIAQESGGGGAPAWRVSETLGSVEKLGATDYSWFMESMRQFAGTNVAKLPHDHHELMAMVAPRALLVTGNTDFEWLANPSTYVSARAAHEVWKTFGIGDRFGFYIDGGHGHCAIPNSQRPAIEAFVDKFLLGKTDVNTDTVGIHPYGNMDHQRWYQWWGTGNPTFPPEPPGAKVWLEPECATIGSDWDVVNDAEVSNGKYVVVKPGLNSTGSAPTGAGSTIVIPFTIDSAGAYNFVARVNCPTADDDSYWVKVDDGAFVMANGLTTSGWLWAKLISANLTLGAHTLTITYREDGAKLDKILVTTSNSLVTGPGSVATNCGNVTLPIQLHSFTAERNGNNVLLSWTTATEQNNKGFQLQRNTDGNWKSIGFIASKANGGTSTIGLSYSFTDQNTFDGVTFYRLIQEDRDGKVKYSETRSVKGKGQTGKTVVYPNPSPTGNIKVLFNNQNAKDVVVFDVLGKVIMQFSNRRNNLDIAGLLPGTYTINITDRINKEKVVYKVVVK